MAVLDAVGRSLAEGWWMLFGTFWALVLGFGLSGAVQAFASRAQMQRALGDHRPRTVAKASVLGAASSSCSYAASALAKSLFAGGADFTTAMVFMVASTNLVIELGIVLWLLIGWQFALAEFIGGAIMIVLLTVVLPRVIPAAWIDEARRQLTTTTPDHGCHDEHDGELTALPWRQRIHSRDGWSNAARYTISDLSMLRRELIIGFVVAGFLTEEVPAAFWRSLFLTGHGFAGSAENAALGPFLAIISFVCSIGNVPLAAALWKGGIAFGGVVAFVFADLIAMPLLLIYRRYYGLRLTARLLAAFWVVMSIAGFTTEYLFRVFKLVPRSRPVTISTTHLGANSTTALDALALIALAGIWWLHLERQPHARPHHDHSQLARLLRVESGNSSRA